MLKVLEKELIHLKQVDELIEKSIKNAPEGTVRCSSCKGIYQYYQGRQGFAVSPMPPVPPMNSQAQTSVPVKEDAKEDKKEEVLETTDETKPE